MKIAEQQGQITVFDKFLTVTKLTEPSLLFHLIDMVLASKGSNYTLLTWLWFLWGFTNILQTVKKLQTKNILDVHITLQKSENIECKLPSVKDWSKYIQLFYLKFLCVTSLCCRFSVVFNCQSIYQILAKIACASEELFCLLFPEMTDILNARPEWY